MFRIVRNIVGISTFLGLLLQHFKRIFWSNHDRNGTPHHFEFYVTLLLLEMAYEATSFVSGVLQNLNI